MSAVKRTAAAVLALCLLSCSSALAEAQRLTLSEAIKAAVERNLDLRAELYNPAQLEADVQRGKGIYDPVLGAQVSYADSTTATSALSSPGFTSNVETLTVNSSLSSLFWTGGTASLTFNNSYIKTDDAASLPNYWKSGLGASFSQPLLKNAGKEQTEISISTSRLSKFAAMERYMGRMLALVAQVRTEYFKLYSLREELDVRKVSLELARKVLVETKARVAAGVLPAMEILNAEFGAATREKDLIDAEKAVRDQVDLLRVLLQLPGSGDLLTVEAPSRGQVTLSESDSLKKAADRPDIRELRRNLELAELQTRVFSGRTLPDLTLNASAGMGGLDKNYQRTLDRMFTYDTPYWSFGLNFSYPLGNGTAENDYRKSRLKAEQSALQLRSIEESTANEVTTAIRGVTAGFKQMEVADRGRVFAEERLRAFTRKNEVGLATTKDVLDVENDLAAAKSNQIKAVVAYANALTTLWKATGELLEREGIRFVEDDADRLYKNIRK